MPNCQQNLITDAAAVLFYLTRFSLFLSYILHTPNSDDRRTQNLFLEFEKSANPCSLYAFWDVFCVIVRRFSRGVPSTQVLIHGHSLGGAVGACLRTKVNYMSHIHMYESLFIFYQLFPPTCTMLPNSSRRKWFLILDFSFSILGL